MDMSVALAEGWRLKSNISSRVGTWPMRAMASGGMVLIDLTDAEREPLKIARDSMALKVKYLGEYNIHGAAKRAGFLKDDVLVAVDGITRRLTEGEFIGQMLVKHAQKEQVKATVLRGGNRVELVLPMQ